MKLSSHHTPMPQYKPELHSGTSGVIRYQLNEDEKAYARAGNFDLIPNATERGLEAPPPEPIRQKLLNPPKIQVEKRTKSDTSQITKELLQQGIEAGKTQGEIARELNVSAATISAYERKFGLLRERKPTRHQGARVQLTI